MANRSEIGVSKKMKKTKIVCTVGPACEDKDLLIKMLESGMNVARMNFSHGSHEEHKIRMDLVKSAREIVGKPVGIMLDTKGPEVRIGSFVNGRADIIKGKQVILTTEEILGTADRFSISYKELPKEAKEGTRILIADGLIALSVKKVEGNDVFCEALNDGALTDKKNVNIPGATSKLPALTEKDKEDLKFGVEQDIDFIAASFIRKASDVLEIKQFLQSCGGDKIFIISKIENQEGVDNIDEILKVTDGLMVARGDLGVEIPTEEMPLVQKMLIRKANEAGKPVITATQMLESMIKNPRPTRAEVTDIANSILDGTDAIMLSGETAAGAYPVEAVRTMAEIAKKAESAVDFRKNLTTAYIEGCQSVSDAISHASCATALDLGAAAIIIPTHSGTTARMVSRFRPSMPIIAAVVDEHVRRRLSLMYGVYSVVVFFSENTDDVLEASVKGAVDAGYVQNGELVVITAGIPVGVSGTTNMLKVHVVGEVVAKGTAIGSGSVSGKVFVVKDGDLSSYHGCVDCIMVADRTNNDMLSIMEKAAGFIICEGDPASHAAIVATVLKKPIVYGVANATEIFKSGQTVTIDTATGQVYSGRTNL